MPAASTSACLGPSTPLSPVVLGTELSQGLPPSSPLLPEGLSLQTGTVIFYLCPLYLLLSLPF